MLDDPLFPISVLQGLEELWQRRPWQFSLVGGVCQPLWPPLLLHRLQPKQLQWPLEFRPWGRQALILLDSMQPFNRLTLCPAAQKLFCHESCHLQMMKVFDDGICKSHPVASAKHYTDIHVQGSVWTTIRLEEKPVHLKCWLFWFPN